MSQEILYTSAPRGLKPGSGGYCTVASTSGMSAPLAEKLESLSGYRQVFAPHDPKAGLNPVVYSHLRVAVGGKTYSVLSRICAAGLDYTQRANKFAHHVALDSTELPAGGPAWLLSRERFMEIGWDGQVRILPSTRKPTDGNVTPGVCDAWQEATGDAGWAGVLAENFLAAPSRLVYVIFDPGMETLPLLAEALALLPAERRWAVTFSTYFTKLPPGITCVWRCILRDSPEAKQARRTRDALTLNLCEALPRAEGGRLVEFARTGKAPVQPTVAASTEKSSCDDDARLSDDAAPTGIREAIYNGEYRLAGPPALGAIPPPVPGRKRRRRRRPARRWPAYVAIGSCTALVLISLIAALARLGRNGAPDTKVVQLSLPAKESSQKRHQTEAHRPSGTPKRGEPGGNQERLTNGPLAPASDGRPPTSPKSGSLPNPQRNNQQGGSPQNPKVGADNNRARVIHVALPSTVARDANTPKPLEIPQWKLSQSTSCVLRLLGLDSRDGNPTPVKWRHPANDESRLEVYYKAGEGQLEPETRLAELWIAEDKLMFKWSRMAGNYEEDSQPWARFVRDCVLEIAIDGDKKLVALRKPVLSQPLHRPLSIKWNPGDGKPTRKLFLSSPHLHGVANPLEPVADSEQTPRREWTIPIMRSELSLKVVLSEDGKTVTATLDPPLPQIHKTVQNLETTLNSTKDEVQRLNDNLEESEKKGDQESQNRKDELKKQLAQTKAKEEELRQQQRHWQEIRTQADDVDQHGRVFAEVYMIVEEELPPVQVVEIGNERVPDGQRLPPFNF